MAELAKVLSNPIILLDPSGLQGFFFFPPFFEEIGVIPRPAITPKPILPPEGPIRPTVTRPYVPPWLRPGGGQMTPRPTPRPAPSSPTPRPCPISVPRDPYEKSKCKACGLYDCTLKSHWFGWC